MPFLFDLREPVNAWTHFAWMLLALPATVVLWQRSAGSRTRQLSLLVYGLSLAFCYGGSVLFHGVRLPESQLAIFDRLDHVGVYMLIAGSYTPLAWNLLRGWWRLGTLASTWVAACTGTVAVVAQGSPRTPLATSLYLVMGWAAIFCYLEMARYLPHRRLWPLVLGGILYSIGALINVLGWPVIRPGMLGAHELFHLFVMAGSFCHFWFMITVVASHKPAPLALVWCEKGITSLYGTARRSSANSRPRSASW
jgi:hemolysin III